MTSVKTNGAKEKVRHLYITGKLNGIISIGGTDFYISDLDIVFVDELKKKLKSDVEVREVDSDLDTPEFAQAIVDAFDEIIQAAPSLNPFSVSTGK